jgi:hypothetical protein
MSLLAGVGKRDITSQLPEVIVHDPLYARALALDDGQSPMVIVGMDVVGIGGISDVSDEFLPQLRERIESELGLPGSHVLVNASHTHPPGRLLVEPEALVELVFAAVREAWEGREPAQVGVGTGHEDRFAINRTLRLKDGQAWTIRQAHPCPPDDEVAELGPLDPQIGIIRLDRVDGTPLAVVFNYACHPLMGFNGRSITANYPGFAAAVIEQTLGHDCLALFLQGAGGDVCDVYYKDIHHPRDVRPYGLMLGQSTLLGWQGITTTDQAELKVAREVIQLPRRTDSDERIMALIQKQADLLPSLQSTSLSFKTFLPLYLKHLISPDFPADYSYRYLHEEARGRSDLRLLDADNQRALEQYLHNLQVMEQLSRIQCDLSTLRWHQAFNQASGEDTIAAEVQGLRIGAGVLITSPAEVLTEVGLRVKAASPHPHTFMAAFSNGYIHYGAPVEDYARGGYEVTECLLAPEWQALYERTAAEVLARL